MHRQFLSWYLWKKLFRALPRHPLFISPYAPSKPARKEQRQIKRSLRQRLMRASLVVVGLVILIPVGIVMVIPGVSLVLLFILFGGTVTGAQSAYGIASAIQQRYDKKQIAMLGVTLTGIAGMSWALAVRHIRINKQARQLRRMVAGFYAVVTLSILSFLVIFPAVGMLGNVVTLSEIVEFGLVPSLSTLLFITMILLDMLQSVMTGALIALTVANQRQGNRDTAIASVSLFLLVQSSIYIVFIVGMVVIENIIIHDLMRSLVRLWALFVIRELVLRFLWRQFTTQVNTSDREITALTGYIT